MDCSAGYLAQRMTITLTKAEIETALPRVAAGLKKYLWLQAHRDTCDVRSNSEFRKRFNGFYRVRRGRDWQDRSTIFWSARRGAYTVRRGARHSAPRTGRYEASFASKLLATIDPNMPVIDSMVLRNLDLRFACFNFDATHRTHSGTSIPGW